MTGLATNVRIGTSGYVFDDWVGPFYPKRLSRSDFLRYYAARFSVVEINATYYRIPAARSFEIMARKTPPGFVFIAKANQDMTHKGSRDPALYRTYRESVFPLAEAGKFDGVLLQFPFGFRNNEASRSHLAFLREALPKTRLWAEFRHESWNEDSVLELLRSHAIGYCGVDEPDLPGLMPGRALATTDTGYVRFHGRNKGTWWGGGHERYDWDYKDEELSEWLERIRTLSEQTRQTYVFFNNCYMGRAVKSARILQRLLGLDSDLELF